MTPKANGETVVYTTTGTVSSPLVLDGSAEPQGEHVSVELNGVGRKKIKPQPKATLTSLTQHNIGTLRKINSVVLPVSYSAKYYTEVLSPTLDDVNKLVYYGDIPVGAITCRIDGAGPKDKGPVTMTILTLAILAPYRSLHLGSALLKNALQAALHPTTPPPPPPPSKTEGTTTRAAANPVAAAPRKRVQRVIAHVQPSNEDARIFYKKHGFTEGETVENYYTKIEPRAALILEIADLSAALA